MKARQLALSTTRKRGTKFPVFTVAASTVALLGALSAPQALAYTVSHDFSLDDVQRGWWGYTYAQTPGIVCTWCTPMIDKKTGDALYPVEHTFGFEVVDFVGAGDKVIDWDWEEGFAGNFVDADTGETGLAVANVDTAVFKAPYPYGTWLEGLGANSVKASTENYSVMEHVLSCFETLPYFYADPVTGVQAVLEDPETGLPIFDCSIGELDDVLLEVVDGVPTVPLGVDPDGSPSIPPNESTILNDIAVSDDYSVTKKDDGKALYRFGTAVKRPVDMRMYAAMPLPAAWKVPGANYEVTSAYLTVKHTVTNNPNDQIRPEDMENEAAKGHKPGYTDTGGGYWVSDMDCYEGDGHFIPQGTVFKTPRFEAPPSGDVPVATFSEDLSEGLTNAWLTTIDREPFEFSYDTDGDGSADVSSPLPDDTLGTLLSGPRWRLLPPKFGQDMPGLDIPLIPCSEVPFDSFNLKYTHGELTETIIDLLDWEEVCYPDWPNPGDYTCVPESPLSTSEGWVDYTQNPQNDPLVHRADGTPISVNGAPLTEDFDVTVYIKGDKKAVRLYSATLDIEYTGEVVDTDGDGVNDDVDNCPADLRMPTRRTATATALETSATTARSTRIRTSWTPTVTASATPACQATIWTATACRTTWTIARPFPTPVSKTAMGTPTAMLATRCRTFLIPKPTA